MCISAVHIYIYIYIVHGKNLTGVHEREREREGSPIQMICVQEPVSSSLAYPMITPTIYVVASN